LTDYSELVRCIRDCWDESVGERVEDATICDCDHCMFKDKIKVVRDEHGEEIYTDYTTCETAMVLAAADAIEALQTKLENRDVMLGHIVNGLTRSMNAISDVINGRDDRII